MKLYLVERTDDELGYDEYDAMVVAARTEQSAMDTVAAKIIEGPWSTRSSWPNFPDNAQISLLGTTHITTGRVILASFNAG